MNKLFTLTNPLRNFKQWYSTIPSRELEREAFARNLAYRYPRRVFLDNAGLGIIIEGTVGRSGTFGKGLGPLMLLRP